MSLPSFPLSWVRATFLLSPVDVSDALNFVDNVLHFWRAYGGWTFALEPYYVMNFTRQINQPSVAAVCCCLTVFVLNLMQMAGIIDPFVYRERLTMPKLVIDAGGDEFFMPGTFVGTVRVVM